MSGWARKRFWTETSVAEEGEGFGIRLDGRPVRTPAKAALVLPTRALADALAEEWDAQEDAVRPETMPLTRMANSAIDKVAAEKAEVAHHLAGYGETDLVCYRAEAPAELVRRQAEAWDPWLDWLDAQHGVRLETVAGVIPKPQDSDALTRLEAVVARLSVFELSAFHDLVALPGSLVLGLAATSDHVDPGAMWEAARVDELWQIEQWGSDEEAERVNNLKRRDFLDAHRFFFSARDLR